MMRAPGFLLRSLLVPSGTTFLFLERGGSLDPALQGWASGGPAWPCNCGTGTWPRLGSDGELRPSALVRAQLARPCLRSPHRIPPAPSHVCPSYSGPWDTTPTPAAHPTCPTKGLVLSHSVLPWTWSSVALLPCPQVFPRLPPGLALGLQGDQHITPTFCKTPSSSTRLPRALRLRAAPEGPTPVSLQPRRQLLCSIPKAHRAQVPLPGLTLGVGLCLVPQALSPAYAKTALL